MIFQRKNKGRKAKPRGAGYGLLTQRPQRPRRNIGGVRDEGAIAGVRKHTSLSVPEGIPQSGGVGVMAAIPALLRS